MSRIRSVRSQRAVGQLAASIENAGNTPVVVEVLREQTIARAFSAEEVRATQSAWDIDL